MTKPIHVAYFNDKFELVMDAEDAAIAKVRFSDGSVRFAELDKAPTADAGTWQEQQHPRGGKGSAAGGKFVGKGGSGPAFGAKGPKAKQAGKEPVKTPKRVHNETLNMGEEAADIPRLRETQRKAYAGEPVETSMRLTKLETDAEGMRIALAFLRNIGFKNARPANTKGNNFPVDIFADHRAVELKSGQVSNTKGAQQFRVTLGQPGKAETELLKRMSSEEKLAHNAAKMAEAMRRKFAVAEQHGMRTQTMTVLFNPDTKHADIFMFEGYHKRIGWNSEQMKEGYVGSFFYD